MAIHTNVSHLVYIILSPVVSTLFAVLNMLSIVIFVRKFRLASFSLIILVNICVCDILVCLVSNNFYVGNLLHPTYAWATGAMSCKLFKTLTMMCNLAQIYSTVILCFDRMRRFQRLPARQWKRWHGAVLLVLTWTLALCINAGRMVLYDVREVAGTVGNLTNATEVIDFICKPSGFHSTGYIVMTVVQFTFGYFLPLIGVLSTVIMNEYYIRNIININIIANSNSKTLQMNRQLSIIFNLMALLFLGIWTPFFVFSILELKQSLLDHEAIEHISFSLRCTLLVIGSGKPLIYIIGLSRFRRAFFDTLCRRSNNSFVYDETSSSWSHEKEDTVARRIPSLSEKTFHIVEFG